MLNNSVYDNGQSLLGRVKGIRNYVKSMVDTGNEKMIEYETYANILEDLEQYNDEAILIINYDCPLDCFYVEEIFDTKDIVY